jgi:hypothetical protein
MLVILTVILGLALILAGRKLFWLSVGAIGFLIGVEFATRLIRGTEVLTILAALAFGITFAMIATFLESAAIGIAGFLGGAYALTGVATQLGVSHAPWSIVVFILGGILGAILVALLFDWALISISSLVGASMVLGSLGLPRGGREFFYLGLVFLGVLVQGFAKGGESPIRPAR